MFKQKKVTTISIEKLADIVSYNQNEQVVLKKRLVALGLSEDATYGLEEHIKHIRAEAKKQNLERHFFVKEFKKSTFVKEVGYEIPYKYKIVIFDLKIKFIKIPGGTPHIFIQGFDFHKNSPAKYKSSRRKYSGGLYFEFKKNTIFSANHSNGDLECFIRVFLGDNATLSFIGNCFKDINISASVKKEAVVVLEFKNNSSGNPISIGRYSKEESSSVVGSWRLKKGIKGKIHAANSIENSINESEFTGNNKIKVTPEQVEGAEDHCIIRISNNTFGELNIFGMTNFYFEGKNIIKQLTPYAPHYLEVKAGEMSITSFIHWGAHQKLDQDGKNFLAHKKIFTILKQRAITNSDTMQEMILQREISKCDHAIVKSEKGWGTYENKAIFLFSKYISNYGTSWIKPLLWLAALNLAIAVSGQYSILIYNLKAWVIFDLILLGENFDCIFAGAISDMLNIWTILSDSQTCSIFWRLLNPTNSLTDIPWETTNPNGWISFLFIFQKVILAVALYEIIKTFRRFGKR